MRLLATICATFVISLVSCTSSTDEARPSVEASKIPSKVIDPPKNGGAIETLRRMGARLEFNDRGDVTTVSLAHVEVDNEQLKHLKTLTEITHLHLEGTQISDAGIPHLHGLSSLRLVNVGNTKVSREGRFKLRDALKGAMVFPLDMDALAQSDEDVDESPIQILDINQRNAQAERVNSDSFIERMRDSYVAIITMDGGVQPGWIVELKDDHILVENEGRRVRIKRSEIIDIVK